MSRAQLWTPANIISASRLFAGPICIWLLTSDMPGLIWAALAVAIAAETSDLIDGYVARSSARVSNFGKILDPMADCLYHGCVFTAFVILGWMPIWMLAIILWRDLAVSYLREIAELHSGTLGARISGKLKAFVHGGGQVASIGLAAVYGIDNFADYAFVVYALLLAATVVTAYSFFDYVTGVARNIPEQT